jgi:predicted nucleic acid-binding protein
VAIALDTSVVYARMDRNDADHVDVSAWIDEQDDELVTTPLAVAEMGYLLTRIGGAKAAAALRGDLKAGTYEVGWWPTAMAESVAVADRHESMGLGLVDASLVALAARLSTTRIATLDERHFRVLEPLTGEAAFTLLPADR